MSKSHGQSNAVLLRLTGTPAPAISTTYVSLLTIMPTASNPTGWVEWRESTNVPIIRKRIYQISDDTEPMWTLPAEEDNTFETHNSSGVTWSLSDTATLITGVEVILGVGVFTSESTTYSDGTPDSLTQLIYWNTLTTSLAVTQGESVTFLTGKIKVTES